MKVAQGLIIQVYERLYTVYRHPYTVSVHRFLFNYNMYLK